MQYGPRYDSEHAQQPLGTWGAEHQQLYAPAEHPWPERRRWSVPRIVGIANSDEHSWSRF